MVSPSSRHALMSKKSTSSFLERTRLTANPQEQTGAPSPSISTNLSSGSLVRLPARITLLKLAMSQPPFVLGDRPPAPSLERGAGGAWPAQALLPPDTADGVVRGQSDAARRPP